MSEIKKSIGINYEDIVAIFHAFRDELNLEEKERFSVQFWIAKIKRETMITITAFYRKKRAASVSSKLTSDNLTFRIEKISINKNYLQRGVDIFLILSIFIYFLYITKKLNIRFLEISQITDDVKNALRTKLNWEIEEEHPSISKDTLPDIIAKFIDVDKMKELMRRFD